MSEQPAEPPVNQWALTITAEAEVVRGNQSEEDDQT